MHKKSPLKNTRLVRRKRRMLWFRMIGAVVAVIMLVGGLSWLTRLHAFTITQIAVQGNSAIDSHDIQTVVADQISGTYWWLFPKANIFLYPKSRIAAAVLEAFKRAQKVDLAASGNTVTVSVVERQPSYVWCAGTPGSSDQSSCYFIDADGYIFSRAPQFSGNAFFEFYGLVNQNSAVGAHYLDPAAFKNIDRFLTSLAHTGLSGYALLVRDDGVYEYYLNSGGKILFSKDQDLSELLLNIQTVYRHTSVFTYGQKLEYADMRFGNKVFYKLVGDTAAHQ